MGRTVVQKLWSNVTELKVLLDGNPHVPIDECKAVLSEMEFKVKTLRKREIRANGGARKYGKN